MTKRIIVSLIISVAVCAAVFAAPAQGTDSGDPEASPRLSLTIDECVAMSLKASKGLHAAGMRVEASEAKTKETNAARLPSLKLGAGYTRLSEVPPFEVSLPFLASKFVVSPNYFNNYLVRLSLQQPLFTGFRLQALSEMSGLDAKAAVAELAGDRNELVYAVRSAYWNLYKAGEFLKAVEDGESQVRAHLADVKNLFEQGLMTRNEVLRVEVQLSNIRLALLDARNAVESAGVWLNNLVGLPLETRIDTVTVIQAEGDAEATADPEGLVAKAFSLRPDLKAMEFRVKSGEAGVKVARSSWYPQITLSGNYYDMRPNSRLMPARDKFYSTWDVSFNISMDLWNWGATASQTRQAKARLAQAVDTMGQMKEAVAVEVRQCRLDLGRAKAKIELARVSVGQAEENFRVTAERFKEGLALNADVLDAEVALLQAKTNLTQALVDRKLAGARLEKALGN
jgi:outer membrane protein